MPTHLERYQQGQYRQVWADLVALGPAVRQEPLYTDAVAVARAMMTRARQNVALLLERLTTLKYQFAEPDDVWRQPQDALRTAIDTIEYRYGPLPIVIRAWYDIVGEVDFSGAHPKLSTYAGLDPYPPIPSGPNGDPLVIFCREAEYEIWSFYGEEEAEDAEEAAHTTAPFTFEIGPDVNIKAGRSGGMEVHTMIPSVGFDAPLLGGYWTGTFFIPYLRICFEWGGFPGLRHKPQAAQAAREELAFLTKDLLPI